MYRLARVFAGTNAALLAAVLYLVNPYMLFTAYERTAYARTARRRVDSAALATPSCASEVTIPRIAVPVALLWLTNAPAAVMGSYTLALLAAFACIDSTTARQRASRHRLCRLDLATDSALRLALRTLRPAPRSASASPPSTLFPPPTNAATCRSPWPPSRACASTRTSSSNTPAPHPTTLLHDQVLHTASLIAVILLVATAVALAAVFLPAQDGAEPRKRSASPSLPLAILDRGHRLHAHSAEPADLGPRPAGGFPAVPLAAARDPRARPALAVAAALEPLTR